VAYQRQFRTSLLAAETRPLGTELACKTAGAAADVPGLVASGQAELLTL
jgi:hypothetical protein